MEVINGVRVHTLHGEELKEHFGVEDPDEVFPVSEIPAGVRARIVEIGEWAAPDQDLYLGLDWEKCLFGMMEGSHGPYDTLAFTDDGRVGFGGINHPRYFPTFDELMGSRG